MDLPNYTDLGKIYEMNPGAFMEAQDQMGLARQFQGQKFQQEGENLRAKTLANQFTEQNNPQLLEHQGLVNRGLGVDTRIKEGTEALQLDAKQKEFIQKAKQSDLDMMEIQGQQWAYSPDPKLRAQGEEILRMHKDFIKMRDQGKIAEDSQRRLFKQQSDLQGQREAAADRRATQRITAAATKAKGNVDSIWSAIKAGKTSPANAAAAFGAAALQAQAEGDLDGYRTYSNAAAQMEQLALTTRNDPTAGKTQLTPDGLQPMPARPPVFTPQPTPAAPTAAPKHGLADVQKMYPGVPADKLREVYKKKFGVDLQ